MSHVVPAAIQGRSYAHMNCACTVSYAASASKQGCSYEHALCQTLFPPIYRAVHRSECFHHHPVQAAEATAAGTIICQVEMLAALKSFRSVFMSTASAVLCTCLLSGCVNGLLMCSTPHPPTHPRAHPFTHPPDPSLTGGPAYCSARSLMWDQILLCCLHLLICSRLPLPAPPAADAH